MASVLALVSKAVWAGLGTFQLGDVVGIDRYTSKHAAFAQLEDGDSIVLVTVRPKGLLLVAILDQPKRRGDALVGAGNRTPLAFIDAQLRKLQLADGKGITAPLDKLGMSLQTPRVLAAADIELLRGAAPTSARRSAAVVKMKVAPKASRAKTATPKLRGGELGAKAKALVAQIYKAPDDRALRGVLADQLLEDQHVWGELISLQLTNPKAHAKRIEQITKQHARELVGEIANVAARDAMTFVDGFLHTARCAKSSSFTSAGERHAAAIAPQWATVRTVQLTGMMPGTFIRELLSNPASKHLTRIEHSSWAGSKRVMIGMLVRAAAGDPWTLIRTDRYNDCARILDALPAAELARIPEPTKPDCIAELAAARARRTGQVKPRKRR